jgi:hypothetical protein
MGKDVRHSQEAMAQEIAERGYVLVGEYRGLKYPVKVRCEVHEFECDVYISNLRRGKMRCCGMVDRRATLSKKMTGSGNNFFGRKHSLHTRSVISAKSKEIALTTAPRGVADPSYDRARDIAARRGVPREREVCEKLSAYMRRRHSTFEYCCRKAASGKTAGKQGIFYIVRVGSELKLGSATTTMNYRLTRLRAQFPDVALVLFAIVPDAGAYEAAMMHRYRDAWLRGEYFSDFLSSL